MRMPWSSSLGMYPVASYGCVCVCVCVCVCLFLCVCPCARECASVYLSVRVQARSVILTGHAHPVIHDTTVHEDKPAPCLLHVHALMWGMQYHRGSEVSMCMCANVCFDRTTAEVQRPHLRRRLVGPPLVYSLQSIWYLHTAKPADRTHPRGQAPDCAPIPNRAPCDRPQGGHLLETRCCSCHQQLKWRWRSSKCRCLKGLGT